MRAVFALLVAVYLLCLGASSGEASPAAENIPIGDAPEASTENVIAQAMLKSLDTSPYGKMPLKEVATLDFFPTESKPKCILGLLGYIKDRLAEFGK